VSSQRYSRDRQEIDSHILVNQQLLNLFGQCNDLESCNISQGYNNNLCFSFHGRNWVFANKKWGKGYAQAIDTSQEDETQVLIILCQLIFPSFINKT
jgi:hypothetical protein